MVLFTPQGVPNSQGRSRGVLGVRGNFGRRHVLWWLWGVCTVHWKCTGLLGEYLRRLRTVHGVFSNTVLGWRDSASFAYALERRRRNRTHTRAKESSHLRQPLQIFLSGGPAHSSSKLPPVFGDRHGLHHDVGPGELHPHLATPRGRSERM